MKKIIAVFLVVMLVFSLCACSKGISGKEAKQHVNEFLEKVKAEDYSAAEEYLHAERPADIQMFFEGLEHAEGVDFSTVSIKEYTGLRSTLYDSTVGGSTYTLMMKLSVSGKTAELEIELVRNENGYGIYNLDVDVA